MGAFGAGSVRKSHTHPPPGVTGVCFTIGHADALRF